MIPQVRCAENVERLNILVEEGEGAACIYHLNLTDGLMDWPDETVA